MSSNSTYGFHHNLNQLYSKRNAAVFCHSYAHIIDIGEEQSPSLLLPCKPISQHSSYCCQILCESRSLCAVMLRPCFIHGFIIGLQCFVSPRLNSKISFHKILLLFHRNMQYPLYLFNTVLINLKST